MTSDVLIVGAGPAGCSAALLFAQSGLQVCVVEKKTPDDNYKRLCTHFIQPSSLPILRRLKLDTAIEEAGGLRNKADIWTRGGWIRSDEPYTSDESMPHGFNIERRVLDPLMRKKLGGYQNIQYFRGYEVVRTLEEAGRVEALVCRDGAGTEHVLKARLIVAADGRFSKIAGLIGHAGVVKPNNRFACFAYFKDIPLHSGNHSQFWMLNPDMAFAYPLQNNTTLLCLFIRKTEWGEWKDNLEGAFVNMVKNLPDAPPIERGRRISTFYRMMDMPNVSRAAEKKGVAFIGDAALALDPMSGVGCGFAFQSAEWLVDHVSGALMTGEPLATSLASYAEYHRKRLSPHAAGIMAESIAEPEDEKRVLFYRQVADDPELTRSFLALTGRIITPQAFQSDFIRKTFQSKKNFK